MENVLNLDQPCNLRIASVFTRLNSKGDQSLGMVLAQRIKRPNRTVTGNPLNAVTLGAGATTKVTFVQTIAMNQWPTIADKLRSFGVEVPDTLPEATSQSNHFVRCDVAVEDVLGVSAEIQVTESPYPNPFNPNQTAQTNPTTGAVIVPLNADGDPITAEDGAEFTEYYRHTEVVAQGTAQHQFIRDYVEGISRMLSVQDQLRYTEQQSTSTEVAAGTVYGG